MRSQVVSAQSSRNKFKKYIEKYIQNIINVHFRSFIKNSLRAIIWIWEETYWDRLSKLVDGNWGGKFDDSIILDNKVSVVFGMGDEFFGWDPLALGVIDISDIGGEGGFFAMSSTVQKCWRDDWGSAKVTCSLERRLKFHLKKLPAKPFSEENQKENKVKNTCHGICPLVALEQPIQKPVEDRAGTISLIRAKRLLEIG